LNTCCANTFNYIKTPSGFISRDNYPSDGYCMDRAQTGILSIGRYSAPATTGLEGDGVVETKCIEDPKFEGIDTLAFFATESIDDEAEIEDKGTTFLYAISPQDEAMYLYDESKKAKQFVPL
jgi:hypothetical protein